MRISAPYLVYNITTLIGLGMIGAGVFLSFGLGPALTVSGVLVISLTLYGLHRLERP